MWGPSQVPSILGFWYYIVFVDDFSHASWVYLLKDWIDVLPSIHQFLQEISTQYSKTPQILRTDNALEYVQTAQQDLCISHGILHHTTCPHQSLSKMVLLERKHCHLLDMTHPLLVEMIVLHFCGLMPFLPLITSWVACPRHLLTVKYPFVIYTLLVTSLPCLLGCLIVWPLFMIRLLIHPNWLLITCLFDLNSYHI